MLLVSKTYEIVTPESAENGEAAENGFEYEDQPMEFRELVAVMKRYSEPSQQPVRETSFGVWLTQYESDHNYSAGETTNYSLHFGNGNPDRKERYWMKAMKCAGFIRDWKGK